MRFFLIIFLLATVLPSAFAAEPAKAKPAATVEQATAVITSRAALRDYLQNTTDKKSPLDALSPGARKRFLASLQFGRKGLAGFSWGDLAEELDRAKIRSILVLFGQDAWIDNIDPSEKPLRGSDPPTAVDRGYTAFYTANQSDLRANDKARAAHAQSQYQNEIAGYSPAGLNAHDLSLLYRAALYMALLEPDDSRYLQDARKALDALKQQGQATPTRVTSLHNALVAGRDFSGANRLATNYPSATLTALPAFQDTTAPHYDGPSILFIDPTAKDMVRKPVDLDTGTHIVITAGCHFSADAVKAVEAHSDLARVFERHGLWLASQSESLAAVTTWNQDHPHQPMNVAWADDQWKRITSWAMPTFYIFKHGKLVDQWAGWPADTGLGTLRQHLQENGFLDSSP